jgi:ArsR family transcriptional regulator, arsenate/arsenite/antimonite-responsive transcriptional repressor / arsenate reductase (thioredoxin)
MLTTSIDPDPPMVLKLLAHEVRWQLLSALVHSDYRVQELVERVNRPMNLISYHLKQLRSHQLVTERRSSADGRDVYYSVDLTRLNTLYHESGRQLHPALSEPITNWQRAPVTVIHPPLRVLFLCTHNSARSQIAEALLRQMGGSRIAVFSAGTQPATVHPMALAVLKDQNIECSQLYAKHIDTFTGQPFDYVITVCDRAREACPIFPNDPEQIHWSLEDPAVIREPEEQTRIFKRTLIELSNRIRLFLLVIDRDRRQ